MWLRREISGRAMCLVLVSALPPPVLALQMLDARDGVAIEAILSIKEPTRIRIEGAAITDVFGNIHSSNCSAGSAAGTTAGIVAPTTSPGGEVVLECDRDKGEIYIRPVGDSPKPVNLFVSSAHATYTLVLRRADTPADTIVIRDRSQRPAPAGPVSGPLGGFGPPSPSAHHIRTMKALLMAMASDRVPPDIRVDELHQPMQLWAETRFMLTGRYEGRGLVGEKYLLKNIGPSSMLLSEQEFDRPDSREGGQVLGVAVENHKLQPGETTLVFVIRRGGTP